MVDIAAVSGRIAMNCGARMCNSMHIMGTRDSVADRPKGLPGEAYGHLAGQSFRVIVVRFTN
jgi:hypothetical protein